MYPTDLSSAEWSSISWLFEKEETRGRKEKHSKQQLVNAIFYVVRSGCQWRMLPKDFPPWKTVYTYYKRWNDNGLWEEMLDYLNELSREKNGKKSRHDLRYCRRSIS